MGGDEYAIVEEQVGEISLISIHGDRDLNSVVDGDTNSDTYTDDLSKSDPAVETLEPSPNPVSDGDSNGNNGLEGIAYNSAAEVFYVAKEYNESGSADNMGIWQVNRNSPHSATKIIDSTALSGLVDVSDIYFTDQAHEHLFILSEGNDDTSSDTTNNSTNKLTKIKISDQTVVEGPILLSELGGPLLKQPEGLTFTPRGVEMLIISDGPRQYHRYRLNPDVASLNSGDVTVTAIEGSKVEFSVDGTVESSVTIGPSGIGTLNLSSVPGDWQEITYRVFESPTSGIVSNVSPVLQRADFDDDGDIDADDIDTLFAAIDLESTDARFDLNGDAALDSLDADELVEQILGTNYGDADLDGDVDGDDLDTWVAHKFTQDIYWSHGNFNGVDNCQNLDLTGCVGYVDGSDFNLWNANKFTTAVAAAAGYAEGDVNFDGVLDVADIDTMFAMKNLYNTDTTNYAGLIAIYDLDGDSALDWDDIAYIVFDVFETVFGDLDLDGDVDDDDANTLDENYLEYVNSWCLGDLNGDGFVNFSDFTTLNNNYGYGT
jgi:hypothetical protein